LLYRIGSSIHAPLGYRKKVLERRTIEVDFPGEGERALWSKDESLGDGDEAMEELFRYITLKDI
jgi:hypothetical protein